jgi:tetratricopeptide (TPR) repeat protein
MSYERIGEVLTAQGKLGEALTAQGKLDEALNAYRAGLAMAKRLAVADPGNMQWQHGLAVSYLDVGDALKTQGRLEEAFKSYRDSLAICQRLALADPGNTQWQRDLAVSYYRLGEVLTAQGKLEEALNSHRDSLAILQRLAVADPSSTERQQDLQYSVNAIGGMAYRLIEVRNFPLALQAADQAIALAPKEVWLHTNRAHALMFLDRVDEARTVYLRFRAEKNVQGEKSWEAVVLEDFVELRKVGLTHALMDEIERRFSEAG